MQPIKLLIIIGTRPEAIKMAPVIIEALDRRDRIQSTVCVTGQHREMLDQVLDLFSIVPDYDLNLMQPNQTPLQMMRMILEKLEPLLLQQQFDWVLAQGDTTTVLAASLLAFHHHIPFGHVEAGLRTGDKKNPFPEEAYRRIADYLADIYFAPTQSARENLLSENVPDSKILVTGNTVVDALLLSVNKFTGWHQRRLSELPFDKDLVLVTVHRRESFGDPLSNICSAIRRIADFNEHNAHFIWPVHKNPNVRDVVHSLLGQIKNVTLIDTLDYHDIVHLMRHSKFIMTDSGGIQEEAPSLNVPVLILRENTERPEVVDIGAAKLVGCDELNIVREANLLLQSSEALEKMRGKSNPYGDGHSARRIIEAIISHTS